MSGARNDGGRAFPDPIRADPALEVNDGQLGMTLRDWFAGQVAAKLTIAPPLNGFEKHIAETAYDIADAMIAARDAP